MTYNITCTLKWLIRFCVCIARVCCFLLGPLHVPLVLYYCCCYFPATITLGTYLKFKCNANKSKWIISFQRSDTLTAFPNWQTYLLVHKSLFIFTWMVVSLLDRDGGKHNGSHMYVCTRDTIAMNLHDSQDKDTHLIGLSQSPEA